MLLNAMTGKLEPYPTPRELKKFNELRDRLSGVQQQEVEWFIDRDLLDHIEPNEKLQVSDFAPTQWAGIPALMHIYKDVARGSQLLAAEFLGQWLKLKIIERDTLWTFVGQEKRGWSEDISVNKYWWREQDQTTAFVASLEE